MPERQNFLQVLLNKNKLVLKIKSFFNPLRELFQTHRIILEKYHFGCIISTLSLGKRSARLCRC